MRIELTNPPVNEVVLTMHFDPVLKGFKSEHVGLFWSWVASEFPIVEQHPPLTITNAQGDDLVDPGEVFPMPRYWFISEDRSELIQVHKQAFTYNWRNVGENPYPGFLEKVKPGFDKYSDLLLQFLRDHTEEASPAVNRCALTYIDIIEQSEYWSGPDDTAKVVPSFSSLEGIGLEGIGSPIGFEFNHSNRYRYSTQDELQIGIRTVRQRQNPEMAGLLLQFEMTGDTTGKSSEDISDWFMYAHERITDVFLGITDPTVRKEYWGSNE